MLFILLGGLAVIFGLMGVAFAASGERDKLKRYVGTENRGVAAALGILSIAIGLAILAWMFLS